jgi:hypothetical protein
MGHFFRGTRDPRSFLGEGYICYSYGEHFNAQVKLEWCWKLKPQLGFDIGSCFYESPHLSISTPIVSVYLSLGTKTATRLVYWARKKFDWGGTSMSLYADTWKSWPELSIQLCPRSDMSWRSVDPSWRKGWRWRLGDVLLGNHEYVNTKEEPIDVLIPMPEGCYAATAQKEHCVWTRKRVPFLNKITRDCWWFDIPSGIPYAGKGENDWDCGDDGTYGCGSEKKTVEEAIGDVVGSVLRSRRRYGQASWLVNVPPHTAPPKPYTTETFPSLASTNIPFHTLPTNGIYDHE